MIENKEHQLIEKLISVNRVTKVVKGGRIMGFAAQKAVKEASKSMVKVPLKNGTIHHSVTGKHGATTVYMQPAKDGTGIIAGGAMRALFDAIGIKNITAKVYGSTNPYNVVRAAIHGLLAISTPAEIAAKRGKTVAEILGE